MHILSLSFSQSYEHHQTLYYASLYFRVARDFDVCFASQITRCGNSNITNAIATLPDALAEDCFSESVTRLQESQSFNSHLIFCSSRIFMNIALLVLNISEDNSKTQEEKMHGMVQEGINIACR